ncbi:MAG: hypothetical protein R3Y56_09195, partial [Akkermansia sp.]
MKMMGQLQDASFMPCSELNATYLYVVDESGQGTTYIINGSLAGTVVNIHTADGNVITKSDYDTVITKSTDGSGSLSSISSPTRGEFSLSTSGSDGSLYITNYVNGQLNRSYSISTESLGENSSMTRIVRTAQNNDSLLITRYQYGDNYTVTQGTGDGCSIYEYVKTSIAPYTWEELVTQSKLIDNQKQVASRVRTIKQYSSGGWITLSETQAYGAAEAIT